MVPSMSIEKSLLTVPCAMHVLEMLLVTSVLMTFWIACWTEMLVLLLDPPMARAPCRDVDAAEAVWLAAFCIRVVRSELLLDVNVSAMLHTTVAVSATFILQGPISALALIDTELLAVQLVDDLAATLFIRVVRLAL
jgi:hypothetical protein